MREFLHRSERTNPNLVRLSLVFKRHERELTRFLRIAIGLATTLGHAHRHGSLHKDIKPANVLVDDSGSVWLTGFGMASHVAREHLTPQPPEFIAGTLASMAPEQTVRINRSIDSRSDLYALGDTLYEMLTGTHPIELVHCHIVRRPTPPGAKLKDIPDLVSAITMRLLEGGVVEANEAFLRIVQRGREDLPSGRVRWTDLTSAEWRERDERAVTEMKGTGTVQPDEKEYFWKDGVASVLDLSGQKRAEEALRTSEAYLAEAQRLSQTGSWAWSPDEDIRYWSEECYRVLGFDPQDGLPRFEDFFQRIHPDDQPGFRELIQKAFREKAEWKADFRIVHLDGPVRDIHVVAHPVLGVSGHLVEFVGTMIDVTERRRAEQERARLRQLETDLAHANRLSMMGALAASLAHEVRQPIATARNNAQAALNFLANEPPDLGEVREALGCIVGDADRAGDIIDRIRAHIKKAPPRKDRFDLNQAVTEVVELARSAITRHGVSLEMRTTEGLRIVQGDRVQLQQVVLNLVLNAIEAMSAVDGSRDLLIRTEQRQKNGVVSVRDSGPGIDPEKLERVFDAFYTTKSDGVGIGLSICRSIIDAHGGRLWIEANEPHGATFQFTVPSAGHELWSSAQSLLADVGAQVQSHVR